MPPARRRTARSSTLVRALAVAGFAAGNIMMLSVAVWSGADAEARDLFHWLSAAIALPCLAYSGRVFFRSAWQALSHGRTNMDVPISIGVLLAFGMSLYETVHHGPHAYFDAATSLLFFLLIGRTLDHVMRERARTAVEGLARLAPRGASVRQADGSQRYLPVEDIRPGMAVLLAAGDRVPVDGRIVEGRSEIDGSLVSGESVPRPVAAGDCLQAGTLNLSGPLTLEATAAAQDSFLAEMTRLMEAAEAGRTAYRRIADRAARLYAPVIHVTAFATFVGWMILTGDAHRAITVAIAVLIITCPCALGLAVPMVQVVAARRLFEQRHHGQGRRRPGAAGRGRPCRLRQDRHAHRRRAAAGRCRWHRSRQPGGGRGHGVAFAPSVFAGHRRRGPASPRAGRRAGRHRRACRRRPPGAGRRQGLSPRPRGLGAARRTRTVARASCCPRTGGCCAASPSRTGCGPARKRPSPR